VAVDLALLVGFAFGAGMVAFFAPCCAAMLPAYVSYTLGGEAAAAETREVSRRRRELGALGVWGGLLIAALGLGRLALEAFGASPAEDRALPVALAAAGIALALAGFASSATPSAMRRGVAFGALATAGLLAVFVGIGLPIAALAPSATPALSYLAIAVGLGLVVVGVLTVAGRPFPLRIPRFSPERRGPVGFFLFGVAYGLASLSCTFPIFLSVVSLAALLGGPAAILAFAAYALGKGSLLVLVSVLSTASPAATTGRLRKVMPRFDKAMGAVTIAAGAGLALYFGAAVVSA
jgi:cytochrome c biogenesis protein CcdA